MEIELCGYKVMIDSEDYDKIKNRKWRALVNSDTCIYFTNQRYDAENYKMTGRPSCCFYLHREIMGLKKGDGKTVDHINGNTLDCRKENMRITTRSQNQYNSKKPKNNKSGVKGVFKLKTNKWCAQIAVNNKHVHLGYFDCIEQAAAAYCEASKKYHGEYRRAE